jgi:predicted Zn-dependent protease with MMP-like domain
VVIDDDSPPGGLFGVYQGIPLTERDNYGGMVLPDRITIFRRTICASCDTEAEVVAQVRTTVLHEVGHHFGITDRRLEDLGWG